MTEWLNVERKIQMEKTLKLLATWFYVGTSPKAPGTLGTLAAMPLAYFLLFLPPELYMLFVLIFTAVSIWVCSLYELNIQKHDSQEIVLDEVVGYLIALTWLPNTPLVFIMAFLIFRFFDILKPFPIGWIDKNLKGGVGVVADDVVAGIITNMLLHLFTKNAYLWGGLF